MLAKVYTFGLLGIESYPIEVEVDVSGGLPNVILVGMADTCIKESKERVKSAIKNSGFDWPCGKITVNLAPSDIKKEGSCFDLAIAIGILAASRQINIRDLKDYFILGELSLDGSLRPIQGILSATTTMPGLGAENIVVPYQNAKEAAVAPRINAYPLKTLKQTVEFLNTRETVSPYKIDICRLFGDKSEDGVDFSEIKGQFFAKRAIEIAVAGRHNILMIGPPGSGKSMLAKRIPTIMPDLSLEEALEITKIHSVTGNLAPDKGIINTRPFRSPHHNISSAALSGGGSMPRPGEISLAHHGILFLDELPEFRRDCLETMRQPLENGKIRICRAARSLVFPADFMLVCAMNPCPCGALGSHKNACRCSSIQISRYRAKISGPLLDRIDIHIEVPAVKYIELSSNAPAENSARIKERVDKTILIQKQRFFGEGIPCNALMSHKQTRKFCVLDKEGNELLKTAMAELNLSARAYDKILKISRTIADLAESENIKTEHLSEAIHYRSLDRAIFYP